MGKLKSIDGLKGICAVAVFVTHFCAAFAPTEPSIQPYCSRVLFKWFDGNPAVDIFIIISAFLACRSLGRQNFQVVFIKKYLRIAIPVGVILISLACLKIAGCLYHEQVGKMMGNDWLRWYPTDYYQLLIALVTSPFGIDFAWMNTLWMLKYIMISPLLIWGINSTIEKVSFPKKCLILFLLYIIFRNIDIYLINILYGYLLYNFHKRNVDHRYIFFISIFSFGLLIALDFWQGNDLMINICRAICLVNLALLSPIFIKFFSLRLFTWLGSLSMAIYLIHLPLIYSLSCYIWLNKGSLLLNVAITSVSLILLAILYNKYIEKPIYTRLGLLVDWIKS